jgi:hypothetical protein
MLTPQQPDRRRADPGCAGGFAEARAALWRAAKAEGCVPVAVEDAPVVERPTRFGWL